MNSLEIKYRSYAKVQPTLAQPLTDVDWGTAPPAELVPFVEGSAYGVDLFYPFETECQVLADKGTIEFDWDFEKEPNDALTGGEFRAFSPVEASQYYLLSTRVDLLPPPGHVVRTEPHPRYFTETSGTVPLAMVGHLQNEWYPRLAFVVFRTPPPGRRHIFRNGQPFARILFLPRDMKPALTASAATSTQTDAIEALLLAHQPIRTANAAWGGAPQKMENGSEPQPWHCLPFVEGSTYGLELLYPRQAEARVRNIEGDVRCEGTGPVRGPLPGFYQLRARLDLQPPTGHAIRLLPHPRYFTDGTGTVPLPLTSHMPAELCTTGAAIVFRAPGPGQEHWFRPGEPMAQIVFVPQPMRHDLMPMPQEEETPRRKLEGQIEGSKLDIADHIWRNAAGIPFNNHYKLLARAFARAGMAGVEEVVQQAVRTKEKLLAEARTVPQLMAIGVRRLHEQKYDQAREIFTHVLDLEPQNARAHSALGVCFDSMGNVKNALIALKEAVALQPGTVNFQLNLGEFLRRQGRLPEAEAVLRTALALAPTDTDIVCVLAVTVHQQGRSADALPLFRAAVAGSRPRPEAHLGLGTLLLANGERSEARACFEAALALAPDYKAARKALVDLGKA
jgi:Flp pilus assembly protein TadD